MEEKPGVSGIPLPIEMIWSFWKKREISRAADWVGAMFLHWPELQKVGTGPDSLWDGKGKGQAGGEKGKVPEKRLRGAQSGLRGSGWGQKDGTGPTGPGEAG